MPPAQRKPPAKKRKPPAKKRDPPGLTVAITGPTGDIGKSLVAALEDAKEVKKIIGMARRPFDAKSHGWKKTEYRQGDVLKRESVDALVKDADVVVHLAFIIMGSQEESREINLKGSRNVFEAVVAAKKPKRLVYASSVAAYGFHDDNPQPLTEDTPARGTDAHYYSAQKAEVEELVAEVTAARKNLGVYVFRPCIVAGPDAPMMLGAIPYVQLGEKMPGAVRRLFDVVPVLKPVLPDPGVPFQLVHHDDVADAMRRAVLGKGDPGVYNLAGPGELTMSDLADAMGYYALPIPDLAVDATAEIVARLPFAPAEATWIEAFRVPTIMSTKKAETQLGWTPKHTARETLDTMVAAVRADDGVA
jgi:UDP-glucose 4-epimerase